MKGGAEACPPTSDDDRLLNLSNFLQLDGNESITSYESPSSVKVHTTNRNQSIPLVHSKLERNLKTIKRSNKVFQAAELPTIINLNPRSIYNKINEFHTLVDELEIDVVLMSESWEREGETLDTIIQLDDYTVISNVYQRTGVDGRPALIINEKSTLSKTSVIS